MKRLAALAACAALVTLPVCAQSPLQTQLSRCLAITDVLQRLSCYDGVARSAGVAVAAQPPIAAVPSAPVTPIYVPPPIRAPAPSFGSERLQSQTSRRPAQNRIVSALAGFDTDMRGKFTVTLVNGQVWKQLDGDDAIARPRKSARSVVIQRAIFGSYALTFNDSNERYKVVRVQ